jgi:hypothetical protein
MRGISLEYEGWWYWFSLVRPLFREEMGYEAACYLSAHL